MIVDSQGRPLVDHTGDELDAGGLLHVDSFTRPDGLVGGGWSDLYDDSDNLDQVEVFENQIGLSPTSRVGQPLHTTTVTGQSITVTGITGHGVIHRPVGRTDGVEVTVRWNYNDHNLYGPANQVGPAVHVAKRADAADYRELGITVAPDIALGYAMYLFTVFDNAETHTVPYQSIDQSAYTMFDMNWYAAGWGAWQALTSSGYVDVTIRVAGGMMAGWFGNDRVVGPVPVPSWALGRDGWGASMIDAPVHSAMLGGAPLIDRVRIRSWDGEIAPQRRPVVSAVGPPIKSTGSASIGIPVPAGMLADDMACLLVWTSSGSMQRLPGWSFVKAVQGAAGARLEVWQRMAGGVVGPTATLVHSQAGWSGRAGAVLFALRGQNPSDWSKDLFSGTFVQNGSFGGRATSTDVASTSIAASPLVCLGRNRTGIWIGAVPGNTAITVPPGHTQVVQFGTSGPALNIAVATCDLDLVPNARGGHAHDSPAPAAWVGTAASATTSLVLSLAVAPDPRET